VFICGSSLPGANGRAGRGVVLCEVAAAVGADFLGTARPFVLYPERWPRTSPPVEVGERLDQRNDADALLAEEHLLIRGAQEGDRQAFARLVERYWDGLFRWLYRLAHDRHTAEDLAQDAFLKALNGLHTFRPGTNFRAWLYRIAHNTFANHRRSSRPRQPYPEDLAAGDEGPVERALSREALGLLARAVGRLPTEFRAALLLRAEEGLSFREIGQVLGITEETARWRVFKARQKLMTVLAPQLDREKS
jgi:RNA polymerase sigma-70 factor (ECF subfamily)